MLPKKDFIFALDIERNFYYKVQSRSEDPKSLDV